MYRIENVVFCPLTPIKTYLQPTTRIRPYEIKFFKIEVHNLYRKELIELNPGLSFFQIRGFLTDGHFDHGILVDKDR